MTTADAIDDSFFKNFFITYLVNLESFKKKPVEITELLLEIETEYLSAFTRNSDYEKFVKFTNEKMDENSKVTLDFIEYHLHLNQKGTFGKIRNYIIFKRISKPLLNHVMRKLHVKHVLDGQINELLTFADFAPINPHSLKVQYFKSEFRGLSIQEIKEYLEELVHAGKLKKVGQSDRYTTA